jgi:hypothetical protein
MSAMHVLQRMPSSIPTAPHSCPGKCRIAALSAASSATACQRGAASKHRRQRGAHAAALCAERSAPLCRSASVSAADPASAAPAGTDGDTSLGSAGWNQFADAASGRANLMNMLVFRSHRAWWAFRVMLQQGLHLRLLVATFQRAEDLRLCSCMQSYSRGNC